MTSEQIASLIAEGDPLMPPDWSVEQERAWQEKQMRGAERCAAVFSSNPYYAAKAAKDPEYWREFYSGRVNW